MSTEETSDHSAANAAPAIEPRELLKRLQAASPTFRDCRPLAIRIDAAIHERFPEFSRKALRAALRLHTASTRYLKAVEKGEQRFDLDGNPAGEVSAEQRSHAATLLKERFAKVAQQQRAKREAEEAERRKQEKLAQLVGKFSR
ncbi:ProQ/FINO family protein [Pseudothauera lacus]|uniref:ProQ activator of osmoprotectant transporter prop n=1 Tax=Pseudothauera lacus TaxID=2136175 RepID=A0A2T4II17_9RHOO|nr:ProQ/FinO family protein [Pseudothauera lacus]PTD97400.1 ProQ activator of osmoprotectant transporter prop [Pseudothauera lacus]